MTTMELHLPWIGCPPLSKRMIKTLEKAPDKKPLPVSRIALVEIRAKPDIPTETAQNEWSSTWFGPFWGLFNSWGYAQLSSNDRAVNQRIDGFKKLLASSQKLSGLSRLYSCRTIRVRCRGTFPKSKKLNYVWHGKRKRIRMFSENLKNFYARNESD